MAMFIRRYQTKFKFRQQTTGHTGNGSTKDVEIMVRLKYLCSSLDNSWNAFN